MGIEEACGTSNPYLVTACFADIPEAGPDTPAVVAFKDTTQNGPHPVLATASQVGAVWGLAYSKNDQTVFAAAYQKRQMAFGPGGPGAVYRIDLDTGEVAEFATVPDAGLDHHDRTAARGNDLQARDWTGKSSLGGIDVTEDEATLLVMSLNDRRIYRFALPGGDLLGSFAHGAAGEPWAADARPFALKIYGGRAYHGVVNSAESTQRAGDLQAYVYSSDVDGSDMHLELRFDLGYDRGRVRFSFVEPNDIKAPLRWRPWKSGYRSLGGDVKAMLYPMPMLVDIQFDSAGRLALGIADRNLDNGLTPRDFDDWMWVWSVGAEGIEWPAIGGGDTLLALRQADGWVLDGGPEFFEDAVDFLDEGHLGGLAWLDTTGEFVSAAFSHPIQYNRFPWLVYRGADWLDGGEGGRTRHERICSATQLLFCDKVVLPSSSLGDIELLCGALAPSPSPTADATRTELPTATAVASASPSATGPNTPVVVPTRTPTRAGPRPTTPSLPAYLPLAVVERCDPAPARADVALVIDTSSSMAGGKLDEAKAAAVSFVGQMDLAPGRDQVAVVRYDTEAELTCRLTNARAVIEAAIRNLTSRSGTHIDAGLRTALAELQSPRHLERNLSVMILLTDGIQTGTPGEELRAAEEVRAAGVRLYAIGLGADVDAAALLQMAGDASRYHFAPDSADLARIYGEIASDIRCPAPRRGFWPTR